MCTVVIRRRPGCAWPLLLAANRDEMADRPWQAPARHWPDRPEVTAGRDVLAGGTWLGINDHGVVAAVMNRHGTLGPAPGRRSRGELVLEALDHADATQAGRALAALEPAAYRPFNLVVADNRDAVWLRHAGDGAVKAENIPVGLSMLTAHDMNDPASPRIGAYLPRFRAAPEPEPDADDWHAWELLLATRRFAAGAGPTGAMCIETETGFGTLSSSLLALPSAERAGTLPVWRFAPGPPDRTPYDDVVL